MSRSFRRIITAHFILFLALAVVLQILESIPGCGAASGCQRAGQWLATAAAFLISLFIIRLARREDQQILAELTDSAADKSWAAGSRLLSPDISPELRRFVLAYQNAGVRLREQLAVMAEERRQLEIVTQYLDDGVLIVDDAGFVTMINPAACRLLETEEARARGRSVAAVLRHHELIELWQRTLAQRERQLQAIEMGPRHFLQASIAPVQAAEGGGYLVILQDFTPIRRLETVRRDFISNISHELRTPLASLRSVVETLRDGALEDRPAAERFLQRAEAEVDTLTQMVEELLELSRIESGQVPLRLAPTPVADLLLEPMERLRPLAKRAGVKLALDLPGGLPPVIADGKRVQQVVTNLLHNAVKFTQKGGRVEVSAAAERNGPAGLPMVTVLVRDNGAGIREADLPRIFERFYKTDRARTRNRGGTGLGLAIAKHLVEAHGGAIWATSKENKGSTFYFTLPAVETPKAPA